MLDGKEYCLLGMTKTPTIQCLCILILRCSFLVMGTAQFADVSANQVDYLPHPSTDSRGFIDVWHLREEIVFLENHRVLEDTSDSCYSGSEDEADTDNSESPTPAKLLKSQREREQAEKYLEECLRKANLPFKKYQAMLIKFNLAWLPVIQKALAKGDAVAEVILLDCDTTNVIDRTGIESTCSEPSKAQHACARLAQIGFNPVLYHQFDELAGNCCHADRILELQEYLLDAIRNGYLGFSDMTLYKAIIVSADGDKVLNTKIQHNAALIEAATQEFPRAFGFGGELAYRLSNMELADAGFLKLALNRSVVKPASDALTWGPQKYFGQEQWTASSHFHRTSPAINLICPNGIYMTGACFKIVEGNDPEYAKEVATTFTNPQDPQLIDQNLEEDIKKLLDQGESRIRKYLQDDPRWAVFLIDRHVHHEFVPAKIKTGSLMIAPEWRGNWKLVKSYRIPINRTQYHSPDSMDESDYSGTMQIEQDGEITRATVRTRNSAINISPDVEGCMLRYSGSSPKNVEYLVRNARLDSALDYPPAEAFAPFSPDKRYRQVLMNCPGGELLGSDRVRFMFLAGDTLVEFSIEGMQGFPLAIRHFQRVIPTGPTP